MKRLLPLLILRVDSVALQGDLAEELVEEPQQAGVVGAESLLHKGRLSPSLFGIHLE